MPAKSICRTKAVGYRRSGAETESHYQRPMPRRVFSVRGDKDVSYGRIMEVMGTISSSGFNKVALVAELPHPDAAQR